MNKLVIGLAAFVLLAAGGALAGNALTESSPNDAVTTATTVGTTTNDDMTTTVGTTTNDDATTTATTAPVEPGEDVSGPCDEAEHANDPRCNGAQTGQREDRADDDDNRAESHRGRGGDDRGEDNDRGENDDRGHEDRSGPNRGSDDD
jgi:hypothetical protein